MEPLPPVKEVEYRCIIGRLWEELSGMEFITFAFETAKEFSSFRYEIAVRYRIQQGSLEFKVLGMTATRTMMPAFGTARSVLKVPLLPVGIYTTKMIKSDGTENIFTIEVTKRGLQIDQPVPRKRFIDLVIDKSAAAPGAKIISTVSKTPPAPLIPRTIQKRQPPPPTPEELAILAALKSETPEERDAREEMELFGGKKKVDKKELAEAEKDIHELGDKDVKPVEAKPKSGKSDTPKHTGKAPTKAVAKPATAPPPKPAPKPAHAPAAKPAHAPAAKPAHKPGAKPAAKAKASAKTRTASTTVTKHAAKNHPKAAPKKAHAKVKTGSSKTHKSSAAKKTKKR